MLWAGSGRVHAPRAGRDGKNEVKLILASGSERRRELLSMCGYDYEIVVSRADENISETDPGIYVTKLAERKAREVYDRLMSERGAGEEPIAVLGSDTVVYDPESAETQDGEASLHADIIGKPKDAFDAAGILKRLSGRTHTVFTGVAVVTAEGCMTDLSKTRVTFEALSDEEIEKYVASGEPLDKAGAYGIQGPFGMFVKAIEGNYFTVIGLPLPNVYRLLRQVGVLPRDFR